MGLNDFRYQILENNNNTYTIFDSYNNETIRDQLKDLQFTKGICSELNTNHYLNFNESMDLGDTEWLFQQVKPYLDDGMSLNMAVCNLKDLNAIDCGKTWYQDLMDYCENKGYRIIRRKNNRNSGAWFRVSKYPNRKTCQGFTWSYHFKEGKMKVQISSVDLKELKRKVLDKGLPWYVLDEERALYFCEEYNYRLDELR